MKSLVALVDRVSYIGACDLLLPPEEISLLSAVNYTISEHPGHSSDHTILDPCVTGALLERQLDSLEPSRWKEGVRSVQTKLLRDALSVYPGEYSDSNSKSMPVRRARILVRCLEFVYRDHADDACANLGFKTVDDIGTEIENLLTNEVRIVSMSGLDEQSTYFASLLRISAKMSILHIMSVNIE